MVLIAFAVFFVITTAQRYLVLPTFLWTPLTFGLAVGATFLWDIPWYNSFSIAGISTVINVMETLLLAHADRAILTVPRPTNRR